VLVLTPVHVMSQERKMLWVYGVIYHHIPPGHAHDPTLHHAHTFFNTFVSAKRTNRVANLQEQLFSLPVFKYHCPQQFSRSEDDRPRASFPETAKIVSKYAHACKQFLFFYSVLLRCQSSDRPFIAACVVVRSSV